MAKHPIEVITSVERRRRWSREDKERLVAACFEPDAVISEIARAAGIHVSQLFRWRKELCRIEEPRSDTAALVPVIVSEAASTVSPAQPEPKCLFRRTASILSGFEGLGEAPPKCAPRCVPSLTNPRVKLCGNLRLTKMPLTLSFRFHIFVL